MTHVIKISLDESCEMACVDIDGECVMLGNYWDFYPNCHGIHQYGEFNSYAQLAHNIKTKLDGTVVYDYTWKYDE